MRRDSIQSRMSRRGIAAVVILGMIANESARAVRYMTGGMNEPARAEKARWG